MQMGSVFSEKLSADYWNTSPLHYLCSMHMDMDPPARLVCIQSAVVVEINRVQYAFHWSELLL
jgi:hypothetical protein